MLSRYSLPVISIGARPLNAKRSSGCGEVMRFQEQAPRLGFERTVINAGWAHGIGIVLKLLTPIALPIIADDQVTGEQEHLLPVVVDKRIRRVGTRGKAQQPRTVAALILFIKFAGDYLFLNSRRVARQAVPAVTHVEDMEFFMPFVIPHDRFSPHCSAASRRPRYEFGGYCAIRFHLASFISMT